MSGTSFSAPQVAGAAALLLQANRDLTPGPGQGDPRRQRRSIAEGDVGTLDVDAALEGQGSGRDAELHDGAVVGDAAALDARGASGGDGRLAGHRHGSQPAPVQPGGTPKPSAANPTDAACKACVSAVTAENTALALPASTLPKNAAPYWERAAKAWESVPAWSRAGSAWRKAAQAWDDAGAPDKGANEWDLAATAYERAAGWDAAATWNLAGDSAEKQAADLQARANQAGAAAAYDARPTTSRDRATSDRMLASSRQGRSCVGELRCRARSDILLPARTPSAGNYDKLGDAWDAAASDRSLVGDPPADNWLECGEGVRQGGEAVRRRHEGSAHRPEARGRALCGGGDVERGCDVERCGDLERGRDVERDRGRVGRRRERLEVDRGVR